MLCNSCSINKSHKLSFGTTTLSSSRPLEIIFSDVWTSPIHSVDGFKYYVVFIDHYTRYSWLYPLKRKSQVFETFSRFKELVENRFEGRIQTFYSDNGGEFVALTPLLSRLGIAHRTSPPHTPEHNGISERKHRHIVETGLALLSHAHIPLEYWSFAFTAAIYLINRMPSSSLNFQIPLELLFKEKPNYAKLRVFGCLCYPWLRPYSTNKLDARSAPCVFLGYSSTQSAYLCLHRPSSRLYVSRHVQFFENEFPFSAPTSSSCSFASELDIPSSALPPPQLISSSPAVQPAGFDPVPATQAVSASPSSPTPPATTNDTADSLSESTPVLTHSSSSTDVVSSTPQPSQASPSPESAPPAPRMITRLQDGIVKPNPRYAMTLAKIECAEVEPKTHVQALKDQRWRDSMCAEFDSQVQNHTWHLIPPDPSYNLVGCRWVFRIKRKPDGSIDRFKSRLVAKGYNQRPGIDYFETFSPVIKHPTIRLVLGQAVGRGWTLRQLDVNNAFLQGELQEDVYMAQPPGFIDSDKPDFVCKLKKAIYGLKQAPRAWYNALRDFLLHVGFTNSAADTSLFVFHSHGIMVLVLVYVDDIVVTGNSAVKVQEFIDLLAARFSLKDLGDLSYFLGIEVTRTAAGLTMTQTKYINDLLHRMNMVAAKPVSTPMVDRPLLSSESGSLLDDPSEYRSIIGSLQYLLFTRPDIAFAVNKLSQFMHQPRDEHWEALKRVVRYLCGTKTLGLFLSANTSLQVHAFSDADWAGDRDDYKSTGAYLVYVGNHLVSWSSRKQRTVARSSTEAEYKSVSDTSSEVVWVVSLLRELGLSSTTTPVIYCDNVGATYLSANPVFHSRMKHCAVDFHVIRDLVQSGALRVQHVTAADQLADGLTKPLPRSTFVPMRFKIGLAMLGPS